MRFTYLLLAIAMAMFAFVVADLRDKAVDTVSPIERALGNADSVLTGDCPAMRVVVAYRTIAGANDYACT